MKMKTLIKKLKFGVLLTGVFFLASCNNNTTRVSAMGIQAVYRTIPSVVTTVTRYTENKITTYLRSTSVGKSEKISAKKANKAGSSNVKSKPVSIGEARGVRLV
jgi:hypothetical protein